ncbi:MAG: hypothetical protein Q8876_02035 [Bacillota bacterium]|nr:hypothetical protein [Bacillota bacterium]
MGKNQNKQTGKKKILSENVDINNNAGAKNLNINDSHNAKRVYLDSNKKSRIYTAICALLIVLGCLSSGIVLVSCNSDNSQNTDSSSVGSNNSTDTTSYNLYIPEKSDPFNFTPKFTNIKALVGTKSVDSWRVLGGNMKYVFFGIYSYVIRYDVEKNQIDKVLHIPNRIQGDTSTAYFFSDDGQYMISYDFPPNYQYFQDAYIYLTDYQNNTCVVVAKDINKLNVSTLPKSLNISIDHRSDSGIVSNKAPIPDPPYEVKYNDSALFSEKYIVQQPQNPDTQKYLDYYEVITISSQQHKKLNSLKYLSQNGISYCDLSNAKFISDNLLARIVPPEPETEINYGFWKIQIIDVEKDKVTQECQMNQKR